jgi:hypothetical protein
LVALANMINKRYFFYKRESLPVDINIRCIPVFWRIIEMMSNGIFVVMVKKAAARNERPEVGSLYAFTVN